MTSDAHFQHALNEIFNGPRPSDDEVVELIKVILQNLKSDQDLNNQAWDLIITWLNASQGLCCLEIAVLILQDPHAAQMLNFVQDRVMQLQITDFQSLKKLVLVNDLLVKREKFEGVQNLVNTCLEYSRFPSDLQFRKTTQREIMNFNEMLAIVAGSQRLIETCTVYLNLALGFLMLPVLEKKIAGASLILTFVVKYKDREILAQWCDQVQIFDVFFNKSLHPEVVSKTPYILAFLHRNGRFGIRELEKMWHVATKKHDAFKKSVIDVLKYLVDQCLTTDEIDFLVQKIKALGGKDQDTKSLELLKQIAKKLSPIQKVVHRVESSKQKKKTRSMSEELKYDAVTIDTTKKAQQRNVNPFEVPEEKMDIQTADEQLTPRTGGQDESFEQPQKIKEETKTRTSDLPCVPNKYYQVCDLGTRDANTQRVAMEVIQLMWQFCLDESVAMNGLIQSRGLNAEYHRLCINQFTEVVSQQYTGAWFFFLKQSVELLKKNKFAITVQLIISKLLIGLQLPITDWEDDMPKSKNDLFHVIERDLKLSQACVSSYIDFKRESLLIIQIQNFEQNLDDNLETQSSLDGDEIAVETQQPPQQILLIQEESKEETKTDVRTRNGDRQFLDTMVTNRLYGYSFNKEMVERINFLKVYITQCPERLLNCQQIQILWEVLVNNAFYDKERNLFFTWITDVLKDAQRRQNSILLKSNYTETKDIFSDDCLELLFFETLLKLDPKVFTVEMFTCFQQFFLHVNQQYGQLESGVFGLVKVFEPNKLIGIDALWDVVVGAIDEVVYLKSLEFLISLFRKSGPMTKELKDYVLNTCINSVKQYQDEEDNTLRISRSVRVLSQFIQEFEIQKQSKPSDSEFNIVLMVNNQVSGSQGPSSFKLDLPSSTSIGVIKNQLGTTMFPKKPSCELQLFYKGKDVNVDLKTLKEIVGNQNNATMIVSQKSTIELEYEQTMQMDQSIDYSNLQLQIDNLKEFLGACPQGLDDEVIGLALRKCKFDLGEAIDMVTQEDKVADLKIELLKKEIRQQTPIDEQQDYSISKIISNDRYYFNLLFDLLNLGQPDVTQRVWDLLMLVPVNKDLYQAIDSLDVIQTISATEHSGWAQLIDPYKVYKMLYSLQLVNTLMSARSKKQEIAKQQQQWLEKFLLKGGVNHLYEVLITVDIEEILSQPQSTAPKKKQKGSRRRTKHLQDSLNQKNDQARCTSLLVGLVKIFLQAALLSFDSDATLYQLIVQSISTPQKLKIEADRESSNSFDRTSQQTPKFNAESFQNKQQCCDTYDFETLTTQIKPFSSILIFQTVNAPELIKKLLHTVYFVVGNQISKDHAELIQHCLDLILPFLIFQPENVQTVIQYEHTQLILLKTLQVQQVGIRQCCVRLFGNLIKSSQEMRHFVIQTLLQALIDKQSVNSEEFFNLVCQACRYSSNEFFISDLDAPSQNQQYFNANYLLSCLVNLYKQITEPRSMAGYLSLIKELVDVCPELRSVCRTKYNLVDILYDNLFKLAATGQQDYPKLKDKQCRSKAYYLLISLCNNDEENFCAMMARIQVFQQDVSQALNQSEIEEYLGQQQQARSITGYVGLKNFGCTCYMNSLIQQLYMMKDFSNDILQLETDKEVVIELQKIFANLQVSEKQAYAPRGFTRVFKLDGQPVNVREQQDANEFLNKLLENIEDAGPRFKSLLQNCLAGSLCNETKSLDPEYPYSSYTTEPFYCLTLDIQNKNTLQQALDMYVKPDILDGDNKWFCEPHNTKVDAQKRTLIQELKDTVCVCLKRFKFDFQQMQRIKINDHFEFPEFIDFKPWTKAGVAETENLNDVVSDGDNRRLSDQGFEDFISQNDDQISPDHKELQKQETQQLYQLVGVLVHSGSADSGHYYSYIKERDQQQRWLEFNDTVVRDFNANQLAERCYGSKQDRKDFTDSHANAYLLFYQKVKKVDLQKSSAQPDDEIQNESKFFSQVREENEVFLKLKYFLDENCFQFIKELVATQRHKQYKPSQNVNQLVQLHQRWAQTPVNQTNIDAFTTLYNQMVESPNYFDSESLGFQTIKFGFLFAFDMLLKIKDANNFLQWMQLLGMMLAADSSVWLLNYLGKNQDILERILLVNQSGDVREQFANVLKRAINCIRQIETDFGYDTYTEFPSLKQIQVCRSCVHRFVNVVCGMLDSKVRQNWRRYDEYFLILRDYVTESGLNSQSQMVEVNQMVTKLARFVQNQNFKNEHGEIVKKMEFNNQEPNCSAPLSLLSILIRGLITYGIQTQQTYSPMSTFQSEQALVIKQNQADILLAQDFFKTLIQKCNTQQEIEFFVQMYTHLAWGDVNVSLFLEKLLMEEVKRQNECAVSLLDGLLKLEDSIVETRLDFAFDFNNVYNESTPIMQYVKTCTNHKFVVQILHAICDGDILRTYLLRYQDKYVNWLQDYLNQSIQVNLFKETRQKWKELLNLTITDEIIDTSLVDVLDDAVNSHGSNQGQAQDFYSNKNNTSFGQFDQELDMFPDNFESDF